MNYHMQDTSFDKAAWLTTLEERRHMVAEYYLNRFDWRGVPPPEDFKGPRYFPLDERWRVPARLDRDAPDTGAHVQLNTSVGDLRDTHVYGTFVFSVNGEEQRLTAFWNASGNPEQDDLFVPFQDATSGKETYGAGRYLELPRQEDSDDYILDFNRAYNPSCAYSPRWNCPYPPPQNRLRIAIEAGEKTPFEH
jgi:uncharacterized protein (DUF1684 family)